MRDDTQSKPKPEPIVTGDSTVLQPGLFTGAPTVIAEPPDPTTTPFPPLVRTNPLTDQSSLAACALPYQQELKLRGKSDYTITCFLSDLKMFSDFIGRDGVIREDPSASLTLERPLPPLPELLFDDEVQRLQEAAAQDARCHCLVYLVLHAVLKKEEVKGLKLDQIDLSDPQAPMVAIRFPASTGKQHRERSLALPATFATILKQYQAQYRPTGELFACTDRNLNYILARAVKLAGIKKRVTLQLLRDTFAVQQLRANVPFETLREKLGLSDEAWMESREKYRRLAFPK